MALAPFFCYYMKMLSVIIPCRRPPKYEWLVEALDSLKANGDQVEIILVLDDDLAAVDAARSSIARSKNIKVLLTDGHVGCYAAQNAGLSVASGEYVSFCGADDLWHPDRSSEILSVLNSGADITNTFYDEIDEYGYLIRTKYKYAGGVFAYRRSLVMELGGFEDWVCSADSDLYYRARMYGASEKLIQKSLYKYRQYASQTTRANATKIGSRRRLQYQRKWHDPNRVQIEMSIPGFEELFCA